MALPDRYVTPYRKVKDKPRIKKSADWKMCSEHHGQLRIDGEILDYWPTRDKWRFKEKTWYGNVYEFIRDREYEVKLRKTQRCELCRHWNPDGLPGTDFGECSLHSKQDDTHFSEPHEWCADFGKLGSK